MIAFTNKSRTLDCIMKAREEGTEERMGKMDQRIKM